MSRIVRVFCILAILLATAPVMTGKSAAPDLPPTCQAAVQPDLETYLICMPVFWNGDLVVFAHGYVFFNPADPILYMPYEQIQLPAGDPNTKVWLPSILNALGFGFAMTSYSKEGLAVQEGVQDIRNLVQAVRAKAALKGRTVRNVYVAGASEGGLVATLLIERYAAEFKGGLSLCGPVGDFQKQVNYWGDFRAVLDALFPNVLPPDAVNIPPELMADWALPNSTSQQNLLGALTLNPVYTGGLIAVTQAAIDPNDPVGTTPQTVKGILDYNIFATNEAEIELAKNLPTPFVQPYSNIGVTYQGSGSPQLDALINQTVKRYEPVGPVALALQPYQTSGILKKTLVNMHTRLDPIVPFWHQALYRAKVLDSGSLSRYSSIAINRYGHCNFKLSEMLYSFFLMVFKAELRPIFLTQYRAMMPDTATYDELLALNAENVDVTQGENAIFLPLIVR